MLCDIQWCNHNSIICKANLVSGSLLMTYLNIDIGLPCDCSIK